MKILQLSTALPKTEYSTEKLMESFPCTLSEGVKQNIFNLGVSKRYLVNYPDSKKAASEAELIDLCTEACKKAIKTADLSTEDIGYFVAAYDTNPFLCPGLSQLLVREIGFNPYIKHVNAQGIASTAFPKALELAENHLAAHPKTHVLVCVSGVSSYWFQNQVHGIKNLMEIGEINQLENRAKRQEELRKWVATMQFFLFGDGVAAAILAKEGKGMSVEKIVEITNIEKRDYLAGYAKLTALNEPFKFGFHSHLGKEIPELGARYTALALKKLLEKDCEKTMRETKKWVIHTGSEKILKRLAENLRIPHKKILESHEALKDYGNLAGASLPFILEKIISKRELTKGDIVLMVGYGWGFSASAAKLKA